MIFESLVPDESSPTRIAAQVVSGIGFLGAGLIFRESLSVRGLNPAATIWFPRQSAYWRAQALPYAVVATAFVVFVNLLLRPIVSSSIGSRLCRPSSRSAISFPSPAAVPTLGTR